MAVGILDFFKKVLETGTSVITIAECSQLGEFTFKEIRRTLGLISLPIIFNKAN